MSDQRRDDNRQRDSDVAAQLLQAGDTVSERVRTAIAAHNQAIAEAGLGLGILAYALGLVLSSKGEDGAGLVPGVHYGSTVGVGSTLVLLVPFITAAALKEGLQQNLPIADPRRQRRRRFVVTAASFLPLAIITAMVVFAPATPWPAALLLAVASSLPLGTIAIRSALRVRGSGIRRPAPVLTAPLSPAALTSTVALGVGLGAIGALGGLPYPTVGAVVVMCFLFVIGVTLHTRWGLPRLAVEWGRTQWIAFGCSYLIEIFLAVLLSRTTWDLTIVSVAGGILVAFPLIVAAFRPAPIWEA